MLFSSISLRGLKGRESSNCVTYRVLRLFHWFGAFYFTLNRFIALVTWLTRGSCAAGTKGGGGGENKNNNKKKAAELLPNQWADLCIWYQLIEILGVYRTIIILSPFTLEDPICEMMRFFNYFMFH